MKYNMYIIYTKYIGHINTGTCKLYILILTLMLQALTRIHTTYMYIQGKNNR